MPYFRFVNKEGIFRIVRLTNVGIYSMHAKFKEFFLYL